MKKICLVLCLTMLALLWPAMGEVQIISETVVRGNGTVVTEVDNAQVNIHDSFVAMSSEGMVYRSQVNGQNVSINTTKALELELEEGMSRMNKLQPLRDPFKIQRPKGL